MMSILRVRVAYKLCNVFSLISTTCVLAMAEALVHPNMPPTSTPRWEIKEDGKEVRLTFFNLSEGATTGDFQVAVEDDVLIIKSTKPKSPAAEEQRQREAPADSVSFHVRLLVPKGYDKENVRAQLQLRALVVTIPKVNPSFTKEVDIDDGK